MSDFLIVYNLKNLVKQKTYYKNLDNPSCIDLFLTNCHRNFVNTNVFETGLFDFHKMTVPVLKSHFPKQKPNIVPYRSYKSFHNNSFRTELDNELLKYDLCNIEYQNFLNVFLNILKKHASVKKKCIRTNQSNFMTRKVSKTIIKSSKLRDKFLKEKSKVSRKAYTTQRNYCVKLLKKTKREYFANIKINNNTDNKKFWQTVEPLIFFDDTINYIKTINLIDSGVTLSNDEETAALFKKNFCNSISKMPLRHQASSEQADNQSRPQISR